MVTGARLGAVDHGGAGPRVVVVHGGPGAPGSAHGLARLLAGLGRVLESSQRGSGPEPLTVARHVEDLAAFVAERCADERPVVVGHSWGAMLALAWAAGYPDAPRSLVLVGCGTFDEGSRAAMEATRDARLGEQGRAHLARLARELPDPDERLAAMGRLMLALDAHDPLEDAWDEGRCDARAHEQTWSDMLQLQADGTYPRAFAAIRAPVLMLHGARDAHPGAATRDLLRRHVPHLRYLEWRAAATCRGSSATRARRAATRSRAGSVASRSARAWGRAEPRVVSSAVWLGRAQCVLRLEPAQPASDDVAQAIAREHVDPLAAASLHAHEPGGLELGQVARRRRPRAREAAGDVAGHHLAAAEVQHEQDVPARGVGERLEDEVEIGELARGRSPARGRHAWGGPSSTRATCGNSNLGRPSRSSTIVPMASQMRMTSGVSCATRAASPSTQVKIS